MTRNSLRLIRRERGLAITGLAARAKASPSMISAIERWGHMPRPETRARLAKALSVEVTEIWPDNKKEDKARV